MSDMDHRNAERDATLEHLYDMLFQAWPLMRRKLLPSSAQQAEFGMPLSHVQVLAMLEEPGSMSVSEISRRFGIAKPNITPLVDRLISAGLVERVRNKADRRVVDVYILDSGREKLKEIQQSLYDHVLNWSNSVSPEDYVELNNALTTIIRVLGEL